MSKHYSKERVIGSGSFGNVWLVKSKVCNNYFVLKELNLSTMNAAETQHALTEVTVLSRCRHRNIIRYKDAVIDHKKGLLSIIMEYAEGGDLYTTIVKQDGVPFKEHTVITWFTQISLALQYIHNKSILHRDLKTRNIFLTRDKQIKVGDFGIARCLMETSELATTAIGTPYYLSPEICQRKPYSYKSDIWALGCVLFEMAALSHPFQACNFPHLLTMILSGQRKELPGNCSSLMKELVDLLLRENPDDRPTADDILALPRLQPFLSEVWVLQNTSSSLSRKLSEKMSLRTRSSSNSKVLDEVELKRRASVSSADSRSSKNKFGFVSKLKCVAGQKSSHTSRSNSVKEPKFPLVRTSFKSDPYSTYKVSDPITSKRSKFGKNSFHILSQKKTSRQVQTDSKFSEDHDESDKGYQSEEILKYGTSGKLPEYFTQKTSTKKHLDVPDFQIEQFILTDEVFQKSSSEKSAASETPASVKHAVSDCCHSQCHQCMLDMLWKNRIKGIIGPMKQSDERTELIRKLQGIFGADLFDNVYRVMISNWESSENIQSPKCIRKMANSLNYSQVQHLPLMMQLIQLDVVHR